MSKRRDPLPPEALEYFRKQGARGGKVAAANSTPAERSARAKKASKAAAAARTTKAKAKKAKG
jgi:hypothetical protein